MITKDTTFSRKRVYCSGLIFFFSEVYEADLNDGDDYGEKEQDNNNDHWYSVY